MSDMELSFFENSEIEFGGTSIDEEEMNNVKLNSMGLTLMNKKIYTNTDLKGSVNIYVRKELPPGRVVLRFKTTLKLKAKKAFKTLKLKETLESFKRTSSQNNFAIPELKEESSPGKKRRNKTSEEETPAAIKRNKVLPKFMNRNLVSKMLMPIKSKIRWSKKRKDLESLEKITKVLNQRIVMNSKKRILSSCKVVPPN